MLVCCFLCILCIQSEKVELERECRARNNQLAVREAEVEQIPVLRNELEKLRVRMSEILTCFKLSPPPPSFTDREKWYGGGMSREG